MEPGAATCLAEESDGLLLQLLRVADVAVDDAVEVQACEELQDVRKSLAGERSAAHID